MLPKTIKITPGNSLTTSYAREVAIAYTNALTQHLTPIGQEDSSTLLRWVLSHQTVSTPLNQLE